MPRSSSSQATSTLTGNDRRSRWKRGLTCANCRARKTRCDGSLPGCKTCEVYKVECRYERPPPMSQILAMAEKLQESERAVEELREALEKSNRPRDQAPASSRSYSDSVADSSRTVLSQSGVVYSAELESETTWHQDPETSTNQASTPDQRLLSDLSIDGNGKLCYYGPTSAVHAPLPDSRDIDNNNHESTFLAARSILSSSALESRTWEEFALGNASMQTGIPRQVISRLIHIHWTWVNPMFNWVYRPAFMRDMAIGGPCYSPFLLIVMLSHAARFDSPKTSETLISKARLLLGTEIHRPSSVPTAQALLQLSARDLAYGSTSQAWLYSGMAFRMVSDLGLHHSTVNVSSLGHLSAEDLEIRRRLFWSCYFWDKAISLYFGRMPVLLELPLNGSPELVDDSAEAEPWSPVCGDSMNFSKVSIGEYPPVQSHVVSAFENSCKLSVILNDIILYLYSRRETVDVDDKLRAIRTSLIEWRSKSPAHLKCDPANPPTLCPPPNIITQNLLYYTTVILLHRPFYSIPAHHAACREAADNIEKLLLLLEKTFGFTRISYLIAYCVYTGAAVMMQDVKRGDLDANIKMQTFLQCLRQGTTTCPIVQRSLDIITNGLRAEQTFVPQTGAEPVAPEHVGQVTSNYLPAFPYHGAEMDGGHDLNNAGFNMDTFTLLDSFPETQYDAFGSGGQWFFTES